MEVESSEADLHHSPERKFSSLQDVHGAAASDTVASSCVEGAADSCPESPTRAHGEDSVADGSLDEHPGPPDSDFQSSSCLRG